MPKMGASRAATTSGYFCQLSFRRRARGGIVVERQIGPSSHPIIIFKKIWKTKDLQGQIAVQQSWRISGVGEGRLPLHCCTSYPLPTRNFDASGWLEASDAPVTL